MNDIYRIITGEAPEMMKSTQELLDLMESSSDYMTYLASNRDSIASEHMKPDRVLNVLLDEKHLKKSDVIARSGVENHYAYQIFSGAKVPSRDKLLMLCFGFQTTPDETQRILRLTGYLPLYGNNLRDNVILFGLTKHLSVISVNDMLYTLGETLLL